MSAVACSPVVISLDAPLREQVPISTLAGGVGNGYFASEAGGRGFESRLERELQ
jgi:hypothetical protein